MKKFTVTGHGRMKGAIGIFHFVSVEVDAETPEEAIIKSYEQLDTLHFGVAMETPVYKLDQSDLNL